MSDTHEPGVDPGDVQAAIDRHRDIAKYMIAIFAAVAGVLVAGTQLSSLGSLDAEKDTGRLIAAVAALAVAVGGAMALIAFALSVLRPVEMSLDDVLADARLRAEADGRPSTLGGVGSVAELEQQIRLPVLDEDEREQWREVADDVVERAAFSKSRDAFTAAMRNMFATAAAVALAIGVFVWAANPPASPEAGSTSVIDGRPVLVSLALSSEGREVVADAVGSACRLSELQALAVGGSPASLRVATLPAPGCRPAQLVLTDGLGTAVPLNPVAVRSAGAAGR